MLEHRKHVCIRVFTGCIRVFPAAWVNRAPKLKVGRWTCFERGPSRNEAGALCVCLWAIRSKNLCIP